MLVVFSALLCGVFIVFALMLAVNLHSAVQHMLGEFVMHKLVKG